MANGYNKQQKKENKQTILCIESNFKCKYWVCLIFILGVKTILVLVSNHSSSLDLDYASF